MGKPLQKLASLLHDGQIRGEVGIKHIVKSHGLQGRHHTPRSRQLCGDLHKFRPGNTDSGSHLNDSDLLRVRQSTQHPDGIVTDCQRSGRTMGHTLSAEGTIGVLQSPPVLNVHRGTGTSPSHIPDIHPLDLIANLHTAHTLDALTGLTDNGGIQVDLGSFRLHGIGLKVDVQVMRQLLQLTVAASYTDGAVGVVLTEDQAQIGLSGLTYTRSIGMDHHTLLDLCIACRSQTLHIFDLHHTHPAGGNLVDLLQVAQVWDRDAGFLGSLQDGRTRSRF